MNHIRRELGHRPKPRGGFAARPTLTPWDSAPNPVQEAGLGGRRGPPWPPLATPLLGVRLSI
ncbi:MAG: hypothetical protein GY696_03360 [Gammaproteobacteria bacterium]|nr:hypothetical protein [Gammaproteobacteria bacterium]